VIPGTIVKVPVLLAWAETVTTMLAAPTVIPSGTVAVIDVVLQLLVAAAMPLKATVLVPFTPPNVVPVIVTFSPTDPDVPHVTLQWTALTTVAMVGVAVKLSPLLATPPTVTFTRPVVTASGTVTPMVVAPQLVTVAGVPLNATLLAPCVVPKLVPVIVTATPAGPEVLDNVEIVAVGTTVKAKLLLNWLLTVATTLPVVAPLGTGTVMLASVQFVGTPNVTLFENLIVLVPFVVPKLVPVTVIELVTAPGFGDIETIFGFTVNTEALLAVPATVTTTLLLPAANPLGMVIPMDVALHELTVARTPPTVAVLEPCVAPKLVPVMVIGASPT
jgi:hypothetical protein